MLQPVLGDVAVNEESVVTAGKRNRNSSRSATAAKVASKKKRKCWRTSWRTLRIYRSFAALADTRTPLNLSV